MPHRGNCHENFTARCPTLPYDLSPAPWLLQQEQEASGDIRRTGQTFRRGEVCSPEGGENRETLVPRHQKVPLRQLQLDFSSRVHPGFIQGSSRVVGSHEVQPLISRIALKKSQIQPGTPRVGPEFWDWLLNVINDCLLMRGYRYYRCFGCWNDSTITWSASQCLGLDMACGHHFAMDFWTSTTSFVNWCRLPHDNLRCI